MNLDRKKTPNAQRRTPNAKLMPDVFYVECLVTELGSVQHNLLRLRQLFLDIGFVKQDGNIISAVQHLEVAAGQASLQRDALREEVEAMIALRNRNSKIGDRK